MERELKDEERDGQLVKGITVLRRDNEPQGIWKDILILETAVEKIVSVRL